MARPLRSRFICWLLYELIRTPSFLFGCVFLRFKVSGRENLPRRGGFIIASNHMSYLDPLVVGMGCRRHLNFMARDTLFRNAFFGTVIYSVGAFPVKRNSADLWALKEGIRRVQKGGGLVVFPEGQRGVDPGEIRKPLAGVGFLAQKGAVPVIPAYVSGTDNILPKGAKGIRFRPLSVHFGKEVKLKQGLSHQEIADTIMEHVRELRPAVK